MCCNTFTSTADSTAVLRLPERAMPARPFSVPAARRQPKLGMLFLRCILRLRLGAAFYFCRFLRGTVAGLRFRLSLLLFLLRRGFRIGYVAKHLHAAGILISNEHAVVFVDGYADSRGERPRPIAMSAHIGEQLAFAVEDLHGIEHLVDNPDMGVSVHRDALGTRETPGAVAVLTEL